MAENAENAGTDSTLTVELIAQMWRDHAECNWLSDGTNVRWSCGIIHPGPIYMQPTTRDHHLAALVITQVEAELHIAAQRWRERLLAAAVKRSNPPALLQGGESDG